MPEFTRVFQGYASHVVEVPVEIDVAPEVEEVALSPLVVNEVIPVLVAEEKPNDYQVLPKNKKNEPKPEGEKS